MSLGEEIARSFFEIEDPSHKMVTELFLAHEEGAFSLNVGDIIPETIKSAIQKGAPFVYSQGYLYIKRDFLLEERFIKTLKKCMSEASQEGLALSDLDETSLTESQGRAVCGLFSNKLEILTGGPGTGKTFVAAASIQAYLKKFPEHRLVITAPTGKATANLKNRFADNERISAMTLHRLLMEAKKRGYISEELIVIDEASMIDFVQMEALLRLTKRGARLLLIGDPFQLPPVERGFIFRDLVQILPVRHLEECIRAEVKEIYHLAESVRKGEKDQFFQLLEKNSGALIWKQNFDEQMTPPYLCATKKGPFAVEALNRRSVEKARYANQKRFPILVTKNIPTLGLANGDLGEIEIRDSRSLQPGQRPGIRDRVYFGARSFPANLLPAFDFGYALSVHKSQGSESDHPTIVFAEGAERFELSLLYTAITRAKKGITLVAKRDLLEKLFEKAAITCSSFLKQYQRLK